jgi:hypothetical protein
MVESDDHRPAYAFFDPKQVDAAEWIGSVERIVEMIFEQIEGYFSADPYLGPPEELEIGFLKKH